MNRVVLINMVFLLLLGNTVESFSNPVDMEIAKKVAQDFMSKRRNTSNVVMDVVVEKWEGQNSFYVVNLREGGWVMVSADDSTVPVFACSFDETYRMDDDHPDAFLLLVTGYKEQVDISRKNGAVRNNEIKEQWDNLIADENRNSGISQNFAISFIPTYVPGTQLLGNNIWMQYENNSGGCSPTYNAYAKKRTGLMGLFGECECDDRAPIGCGAVALGQTLWFWQYPKSYNWDLMPAAIYNGDTNEGDAIASLLKDCADAVNMTYMCASSFTFPSNIESALQNTFNFKAARHVKRNMWNENVWIDLIRSEIDCERPVIYKGEKGLLDTDKHYFIVDGYDVIDHDLFWINFGWGGNGTLHYLGSISGSNYNYNARQDAIIGISPTSPSSVNITDVSYTTVTGSKTEEAQQNITLPATGKSLTVVNGGDLTLVAGNSITLRPGFHAQAGSQFTAKIEPSYTAGSDMEISVPGWPNAMNGNSRGLWLWINNANSFDFEVMNRWNIVVNQRSGIITGNQVDLWDGTDFNGSYLSENVYACTVRFRNNFGRTLEKTWTVTLVYLKSLVTGNDSIVISNNEIIYPHEIANGDTDDASQENETKIFSFSIFPNPTNGFVTVDYTLYTDTQICIELYNMFGQRMKLIVPQQNQKAGTYSIQISVGGFGTGTYIVKATSGKQVESKQLIINP